MKNGAEMVLQKSVGQTEGGDSHWVRLTVALAAAVDMTSRHHREVVVDAPW